MEDVKLAAEANTTKQMGLIESDINCITHHRLLKKAGDSHQMFAAVMVVVLVVVEAFDAGGGLVAADLGKEEPELARLVQEGSP